MGKLKFLVIHCTDTPAGRSVSKKDIEQWHLVERGWSRPGYSDMIHLDGTLENLIPFNQDGYIDNWEISNGAKGFNGVSKHLVYVGGAATKKTFWQKRYPPQDTRTNKQKESMLTYVLYMILRHPEIKVLGHNDLANKACPSFNVGEWLRYHNIPEKNIG